jgi:hypothetical protein
MATASERKEAAQGTYSKLLKYPSATTGLTWGEKKWYWVPNKAEGFIAGTPSPAKSACIFLCVLFALLLVVRSLV